jgi:DnaJ-class molecular chaperone
MKFRISVCDTANSAGAGAVITILLLFHLSQHVTNARQDLYKTLGVPKTATQKEITKGYRKLALRLHPDKVPEAEREESEKKFKDIGYAHDVLTDEGKRKRYDSYGEQGLDDSFHPGFSNMNTSTGGSQFGGGNDFQRQSFSFGGPQHGGNDVGIDLSDILRQFMGGQGMGMGMDMGGSNMGGRGSERMGGSRQQQQLKPQTREFYCTLGELSDFSGCTKKLKVSMPRTDVMSGEQRSAEKIYTIDVQPGWKEGTKVRFKASKDGFPPMTFVLKQRNHKYIHRRGDDLVFKCTVTDRQAEKGAKLKIPLPDGSVLKVKTEPDEIYDKYQKRIRGKGMPRRGSKTGSDERGDFLIEFRLREQFTSHQ